MAAKKKKPAKKKTGIFGGLFDQIKPQGGVAGRRNPGVQSQLDEFGEPRTKSSRPKSKKKTGRKKR